MNRRDLIKSIAMGAPMMAMVTPAIAFSTEPVDETTFHGWNIEWTGWKDLVNTDVVVCQYIAYAGPTKGKWSLYSSWPGECGPFMSNSVFNIGLRHDQELTTHQSSTEDLKRCKAECFDRLKRLIIKLGPPPFKSKWDELDPIIDTWSESRTENFMSFEKRLGFLGSKSE